MEYIIGILIGITACVLAVVCFFGWLASKEEPNDDFIDVDF